MLTQAQQYNADRLRPFCLELSAVGLQKLASMPHKRSREDVDKALAWAADVIEQQDRLIKQMRGGLAPFADVAQSCRGSDDEILVDRRGQGGDRYILRN